MPKKGVVSIFLSLAVLLSLCVTPLSASAAYALPDTVALSANAAYVVSLGDVEVVVFFVAPYHVEHPPLQIVYLV